VTPCRQYDSRSVASLPDNANLAVTLTGAPCGLPSSAQAVSVNITVFDITGAGGNGVFRVGTANDPTTAWINYPSAETQRGNAGVVPLNISGQIVVKVNQGGGSVDFTVDVNGYYPNLTYNNTLAPGEWFSIQGSVGGAVINGTNNYSAGHANGVQGSSYGTGPTSSGVVGLAVASIGQIYGVSGWQTAFSASDGSAGVFGQSQSTSGKTYGVYGNTLSASGAGVYGTGSGVAVWGDNPSTSSGVNAVKGVITSSSPGGFSAGVRGINNGTSGLGIGVYGSQAGSGWGVYGTVASTAGLAIFAGGNFEATGSKSFVEPHPTDPTKVIRYVSLEGPESGTYFRGSAEIVGGRAVIDVPETFRIVTDMEGLTVQLTPVGAPASMYVVSKDLNQIVVQSNRDVKFDYMINGVRRAYKDHQAIADGNEFMPASPSDRIPSYLTEEAKQRLISNGTYKPDGTVNMDTAERLGWTKMWAEQEAHAKAETAANAAAEVTMAGAKR
jgi:hypothetical protein